MTASYLNFYSKSFEGSIIGPRWAVKSEWHPRLLALYESQLLLQEIVGLLRIPIFLSFQVTCFSRMTSNAIVLNLSHASVWFLLHTVKFHSLTVSVYVFCSILWSAIICVYILLAGKLFGVAIMYPDFCSKWILHRTDSWLLFVTWNNPSSRKPQDSSSGNQGFPSFLFCNDL